MDLDGDGNEDAIITLSSEPEKGPRWQKVIQATYVFRGASRGSFGGAFSTATLWFSLNTGYDLRRVEYSDEQTRRTFVLHSKEDGWHAEVRTYSYDSGEGEASSRCMHLVRSTQEDFLVDKLRIDPVEFR